LTVLVINRWSPRFIWWHSVFIRWCCSCWRTVSLVALILESECVSCCDIVKDEAPPELRSRRTEVVVLSGGEATIEWRTRPPCLSSRFTVVVIGHGIITQNRNGDKWLWWLILPDVDEARTVDVGRTEIDCEWRTVRA
jgi:hypothetical protein